MRQKNIHGYPLSVPSLGQTVYPGETVEHDYLLPGFEEITDKPDREADEVAPENHDPDRETSETPGEHESADPPTLAHPPGDGDAPHAPDVVRITPITEPQSAAATPGADASEVTP